MGFWRVQACWELPFQSKPALYRPKAMGVKVEEEEEEEEASRGERKRARLERERRGRGNAEIGRAHV